MSDADEAEYGLVMPFVVCASDGGPYDDAAFVAGCRFGHDAEKVKLGGRDVQSWGFVVMTPMVPQYDLLAMHHDFVMTSEPWEDHPDEWTFVTFARSTEEPPDA